MRGQKRMSSAQVCFFAYFSVSAVGILIPIWTPVWGIYESLMIFNFLSLSKSKESLSPTDFTAPTGKNLTLFLHVTELALERWLSPCYLDQCRCLSLFFLFSDCIILINPLEDFLLKRWFCN